MTPLTTLITDVWEQVQRETPAIDWNDSWASRQLLGRMGATLTPRTYRDTLDRPRKNAVGEVIPRITLVRANLRRLQKPPRAPRLPL